MVTPSVGAVVLIPFPFSDLTQAKMRPAIVLADAGRNDWILCQVTSKSYSDPGAIQIDANSFVTGSLRVTSYARPGKLFTANQSLMAHQVGVLQSQVAAKIIEAIVTMLRAGIAPK